ncbi:MAG TPA: DUF6526 family protein [Bacteroidia bacterium]|nr:DUF6526 family protein [Bacteroidia bacterium]HNS12675.1 DUF6526 family protein [Bacteroidia bacterium]
MKKQSYSNHRKLNWLFYGFFLFLLIANLGGAFIYFNMALEAGNTLYPSTLLLSTSLCMLIMFAFLRQFSLRLQERIIRNEENLRHFVLSGKLLDSRIRTKQVAALRYAPDGELLELAKDAAENQSSVEEIKKSIGRWRGDYHQL